MNYINRSLVLLLILVSNLSYAKDYIVECKRCVVSVGYNKQEIDFFKQKMGDNFYVVADDDNHYGYMLTRYIEANNIQFEHIERFDIDYTDIVFPNGVRIKINIYQEEAYWSIYYLYQQGKEPIRLKDSVMPECEINSYFDIANPKSPKYYEYAE